LRVLADPHRARADYRTIPAQDDGRRLQENAPALGQPRGAQVKVTKTELSQTPDVAGRTHRSGTER